MIGTEMEMDSDLKCHQHFKANGFCSECGGFTKIFPTIKAEPVQSPEEIRDMAIRKIVQVHRTKQGSSKWYHPRAGAMLNMYPICAACCCDSQGNQTKECQTNHDHRRGEPQCATIGILKSAGLL